MFRNRDLRDPDLGEASIIALAQDMGEVRESLVDEVMVSVADRFQDRPLHAVVPSADDIDLLRGHCPWGYALDLYPGVTGLALDRQASVVDIAGESREALTIRMSLLDKALVEVAPVGSLLDIATDSGLIPLKLADRIGGRIVGVDRREQAIRRAELLRAMVAQAGGARANCRFVAADAVSYLQGLKPDAFDCISALGLFHRLSDPIRLLRLMYQKTARTVLIDTMIRNFPVPGWVQSAPDQAALELLPTYRGIIDSLYQVGFESVTEVVPAPSLLAAIAQSTAYHTHNRALFVAQKIAG